MVEGRETVSRVLLVVIGRDPGEGCADGSIGGVPGEALDTQTVRPVEVMAVVPRGVRISNGQVRWPRRDVQSPDATVGHGCAGTICRGWLRSFKLAMSSIATA
ncbi:MAG: hypothetical protein HYZ89_00175 [Candidatus Omnitrophica bacterium]|nr:hypothetical protein [Candidatus Omnitrophota bacterium]